MTRHNPKPTYGAHADHQAPGSLRERRGLSHECWRCGIALWTAVDRTPYVCDLCIEEKRTQRYETLEELPGLIKATFGDVTGWSTRDDD